MLTDTCSYLPEIFESRIIEGAVGTEITLDTVRIELGHLEASIHVATVTRDFQHISKEGEQLFAVHLVCLGVDIAERRLRVLVNFINRSTG